jgi:hypothetical protein
VSPHDRRKLDHAIADGDLIEVLRGIQRIAADADSALQTGRAHNGRGALKAIRDAAADAQRYALDPTGEPPAAPRRPDA